MSLRRARGIADVPLVDRVVARALVLGATSEGPTEAAVDDLWHLAGGNREALTLALGRLDHPSGRVGHPGVIASLLLRSALSYQDSPAGTPLQGVGEQ